MADSEDDVPPLEDMSELLKQVDTIREQKTGSSSDTSAPSPVINGNTSTTNTTATSQIKTTKVEEPKSQDASNASTVAKKDKPGTFGGMKKGFLFGGPPSKPKQTKATEPQVRKEDDIPLIKPKDPSAKETQFQMPEVQEAMTASQNLLQNNKDWITDDLLTQVTNNPNLARHLTDPRFAPVMAELQRDPAAAMRKYAGNKDMEMFLKDFCGLMGNHFTTLADNQQQTSSANSSPQDDILVTAPEQQADLTSEEDKKVQDIVYDPEMRAILTDPTIQKLIENLRNDPEQAQRMLRSPDANLQAKIKKMVSAGLLQVQR